MKYPGGVTRSDAWVSMLVLLASVCGLGGVAILLGVDGNYDLRNYHFYNGWALFHKSVGYDIAPAQIQGYQHPLLDGMFYQLWRVLNDAPRAFTFVWSIPQAIAVWLAFLVAREVFAEAGRARDGLAIAAAFIGADGATSIGVIGTSMSDGVLNALMFLGIMLVLRDLRIGHSAARMVFAGLLGGAVVPLKLTAAPYLCAFGAALLFAPGFGTVGARARRLTAFASGAALALLVIGGPWWWTMATKFGNPLFPYYNAIFHSPDYADRNFIDDRFFPRTAWQWVFYPLDWTLRKSTVVSEMKVRDARIGLALLGAIVLLVVRGFNRSSRRVSNGAAWCAIWTICAYLAWLIVFSILRYASGIELMSGVVIVAALRVMLMGWTRPAALVAAAGMAAVLLLATTVYPTWDRRKVPGDKLLDVSMRALPPDSLVILLVATPASYVAAFEPPSVRFIGVYNSVVRLDSKYGLQDKIVQAIRSAPGPIWGIDKTDDFFGMAEQSLARYGLRRTNDCQPIDSNVDTHLRICRLERVA